MRTILTYFLIAGVNLSINAQCVFLKLIDDNNQYDGGLSFIQTHDNGHITCGGTGSSSSQLLGILISKTDECGNIIWIKEYDFSWNGTDDGNSIIQLPDDNYIICGNAYDSIETAKDIYLLKINTNGDTLWYKTMDFGYNDYGVMHKLTSDGGFIIGGYYDDTTISKTKVFLIKTDSLGNKEWQQNYGGNYYSFLKSIDFTPDGGYILGGDFENPITSSWDLFLIKTDSLGNFKWKQAYGTTTDERKGYAITTIDSGFAIVGYTQDVTGDYNAYIVKTDTAGSVEWEKDFGSPTSIDVFKVIRQLSDGSFIVAGGISDTAYNPAPARIRLIKLSNAGDSIWSQTYTYYGNSYQYGWHTHDYVEDLQLTSDGGFIMTGYIINNLLPAKNDLLLIKTDSLGNTCEIDTTTWEGCSETTSVNEQPADHISKNGQVYIYPNPTKQDFTVEISLPENIKGKNEFFVTGMGGATKYRKNLQAGFNRFIVSTTGWQPATYICNLMAGNKFVGSKKLILTK